MPVCCPETEGANALVKALSPGGGLDRAHRLMARTHHQQP
jgi:hypothetical protein